MKPNGKFKIEKSLPIPTLRRCNVYPFNDMNVGDSFLLDPDMRYSTGSAAHSFKKKHGKTFTIRREGDKYRCWRVS